MGYRIDASRGLVLLGVAVIAAVSAGCGGDNGTVGPQIISTAYSYTSFDGPGGPPTTINGINNNAAAIGFTTKASANSNFIRNPGGTFTSLSLGDPAGMANGANRNNTAVGVASGNAFMLSNGAQTSIIPTGATSSVAFGINDTGVIVGQDVVTAGSASGFVDVNGVFTTVDAAPTATMTTLQGINNNGLAIGFYSTDGVHQHGFIYDTIAQKTTLIGDPSTSRTKNGALVLTQFLGINDSNQAAGYYQTTNGSQYGFIYNINSKSYTFLDEPQAVPVAGVQVTQITGIDDASDLAGFYVDSARVQHGFVAALTTTTVR